MHEHPTARALRGERVRGETLAVRRGPGRSPVIIEVNSNPLYDEHGKIRGAVTVERDVTVKTQARQGARRRGASHGGAVRASVDGSGTSWSAWCRSARRSCWRSRKRARASVVSRRWDSLAAGVMHDVNNALNPIMAAAYLLEANAENPAAVRDYAVRIAKAAETGAATAARVGPIHSPGTAAVASGRSPSICRWSATRSWR